MPSTAFCLIDGNRATTRRGSFQCLVAAVVSIACTVDGWIDRKTANAQTMPVQATSIAVPPKPIFWKQSLFQIPYQWGSAAEPGAATAVLLFASQDRGVTWQQISEAKPNVTSFSYRSEGEGEYWFAVRTLDRNGHPWPAGPYQPELCVVVDTTMPQITGLRAAQRPDGSVDIEWSGQDLHLDPATWSIEVQTEPNGPWQPVPMTDGIGGIGSNATSLNGTATGRITYRSPAGRPPIAVRAKVQDLAGNTAVFHSQIESAPTNPALPEAASGADLQRLPLPAFPAAWPSPTSSGQTAPATSAPTAPVSPPGWVSSAVGTPAANESVSPPQGQSWPVDSISRAPLRLWNGPSQTAQSDSYTAYGNPQGFAAPSIAQNVPNGGVASLSLSAQYAVAGGPRATDNHSLATGPGSAPPPQSQFGETAVARLPLAADNFQQPNTAPSAAAQPAGATPPTMSRHVPQLPSGVQPKLVGSRTFSLEYEIEESGRQGISSVELWGTNDGGQSWRMFSRDNDNRTPLIVTVDEAGVYGFRIVVAGAGGEAPLRPVAGEQPELWVGVDLRHPIVELTAVERGTGNLADHLMLRWQASDDNLDPQPISLLYSSRPGGPWSAIATSLENTGEYSWRVERHVPTRFYVRLEARDAAGNMAAFITRDPIEFAAPALNGQLRSAAPVGPVATGGSYR